ncbi:hypothetical protein BUALT_Bualt03G0113800 [Buddleja alternifolia]|uniref:Uncharacterized protein n=1 Tax=Buddleja alternifolia TaxID=168488 RepID=A0AAV6XTA7_9LAMI|nr:hypothetical protein BUALT_Bualt03G0113800 [Buddleja alternifolia]
MQSPVNYTYMLPMEEDDDNQEIADMEASMRAVENLLGYRFKNKKFLEEALTHPSYTDSASYQRLEFVGDAALGLAVSNFVFLSYPDADPGKLSLVRAANVSTENLARVAVRHQLYKYVRHNATGLDEKVREFVITVQQEDEAEVYGGLVKAPKVLADIVESLAAAVYVDCNFDLKAMWVIFRHILEPIVMLDYLEQQPQPVTMLFEVCQKEGKQVDIKHWREGERNHASVYVDGHLVASASSEHKENAKLNAAKAALGKLSYELRDTLMVNLFSFLNGDDEIEGAKQKLHDLCSKKKWPAPIYKKRECGSAHERRYVCSVEIEINKGVLFVMGKEKPRVKGAESSAASAMLHGLKDSNYI